MLQIEGSVSDAIKYVYILGWDHWPSRFSHVRMNAEILETKGARKLGLGIQILEILAQRKFISVGWPPSP